MVLGITTHINHNNNINNGSNGNGLSSSFTDKESITPSPPQRLNDDVKSEPMELVCGSNNHLASDDHSNDSLGESDGKYMGLGDGKGSLRYDDCVILVETVLMLQHKAFVSVQTTMMTSTTAYIHIRHQVF